MDLQGMYGDPISDRRNVHSLAQPTGRNKKMSPAEMDLSAGTAIRSRPFFLLLSCLRQGRLHQDGPHHAAVLVFEQVAVIDKRADCIRVAKIHA